jgi:hypothetical protein
VAASVLSVSSRALLDACARLGLDTTQIAEAAQVDPATLSNPDARIPIEQVDALWRKAYQLARDPDLSPTPSRSPRRRSARSMHARRHEPAVSAEVRGAAAASVGRGGEGGARQLRVSRGHTFLMPRKITHRGANDHAHRW